MAIRFLSGETIDGNATFGVNVTINGGQILTPSGVNLALNPNTGVVSVGGVIQASGTGNNTFAGSIASSGNITATTAGTTTVNSVSTGDWAGMQIQCSDAASAYLFFNDTSGERARIQSTANNDLKFSTNGGGSLALTLDSSTNATFEGSITTGGGSGGNSGGLTIAGGITETFQGSGGQTTFNSYTNSSTASGATDASAFLISQKDTGGSAIEYRQGVIADGNAFFGKWHAGSITGIGLEVSTGNVTFSGDVTVSGTITLGTASFVGTVAGATVVSSTGAYASAGSVKLYEAKRTGGAVGGDWSYDDATTDMSLGTNTNHAFALKTNNTRRIIINNTGKVIVGTDSSNALEVFSSGDTEIGFSYATQGNVYSKIIGDVTVASPLAGELAFQTASGGSLSERMRITSGGDITVSGGDLFLNSGTSYNDKGVVYFSNERTAIISDIVNLTANGDTSLDFQTRSGGTRASSIFIDEFRKVGIGTTSPAALLEIAGSGDALRIESTNTGSGGAQVDLLHFTTSPADNDTFAFINMGGYYTGTSSVYGTSIRGVWSDVSARDAELQFWTNNSGTLTEVMSLTSEGNLVLDSQSTSTGTTELNKIVFRKCHGSGCNVAQYDQASIRAKTFGGYSGGLNFYTSRNVGGGSYADTFAMAIDNEGKVGIGTDSPDYQLTINNTGGADTLLKLENTTSNKYPNIRFVALDASYDIGVGGTGTATGYVNNFYIYDVTNSAPRITLTQAGNVGIGTTIPSTPLMVNRASNSNEPGIYYDVYGGGSGSVGIGSTAAVGPFIVGNTLPNGDVRGAYSASRMLFNGGGFSFQTSDETSGARTWDDRMKIEIGGNVGIGISTPHSALQVKGSVNNLVAHFGGQNNTNGQWNGISLGYAENSNASYRKVGIVAEALGDGAARQNLHFLVDTVSDGNSAVLGDSKMMIEGLTGNVGVGTSGPVGVVGSGSQGNTTLHVEGPLYNKRIMRGWYICGPITSTDSYRHIKTNLWMGGSPAGNTEYIMGGFEVKGYAYFGSYPGFGHGTCMFHNWSGSFVSLSVLNFAMAGFVQNPYVSTDGYCVLVLRQNTYCQPVIDFCQYYTPYPWRSSYVTAETTSNNLTGVY